MLKHLIFSLVLLVPGVRAQTPFQDAPHKYSLTIPSGWVAKTQAEVDEFDGEIQTRVPDRNFRYVAGFKLEKSLDTFPYILVQKTDIPMRGTSYDDIEKALGAKSTRDAAAKIRDTAPDLIKSASLGGVRLDRATNRVFLDLRLTDADGNKVRGLSVMHLTREGALQLNFYSTEANYEKELVQFEPFLASFKVDAGYEFKPSSGFDFSRIGVKAAIGAAIGVALAFGSWMRKKNAKPSLPTGLK